MCLTNKGQKISDILIHDDYWRCPTRTRTVCGARSCDATAAAVAADANDGDGDAAALAECDSTSWPTPTTAGFDLTVVVVGHCWAFAGRSSGTWAAALCLACGSCSVAAFAASPARSVVVELSMRL